VRFLLVLSLFLLLCASSLCSECVGSFGCGFIAARCSLCFLRLSPFCHLPKKCTCSLTHAVSRSFGATTVVLDSELGSEIPGEGDSSGAFSTLMLTFGIICLVVICVTIARGHKSRTHEPVSQQRGGGIQELNGSRWQRRVTVVPGYGNGSTNRSPQPQGPTRNIEVQPTSTAPRQAGNEYDAHRPEPVLVAMPIVHAKEVGRAP
jgi:hypothetical protein